MQWPVLTIMSTDTVTRGLVVRHLILPALAPAAIVALYFTPVLWFGCVNRGLMAIAVALISAAAAFVCIGFGMRAKLRREPQPEWWLLSTLLYTLPLALLIGPLG
jgi:hypothetical protein